MNKLIFAGAAALALAVPAVAQDMAVDSNGNVYVMTSSQQTTYDGWPADRQSDYKTWPNTYQTYYWTLTPSQQTGWWALTADQRAKVYAMTPDQRTTTWASIERQMSSTPSDNASMTAQTATTSAMTANTMGPRFVSNAVSQTTPAASTDGNYPPCKGAVQDHCVNPREAGLNYGNRPLGHWPGKPASEIPGPKK